MSQQTHKRIVPQEQAPFRILDWTVDPASCRLLRGDEEVHLEPRVMALLVYLAQHPGQVLSREELESRVWAGMVVGYDALTSAIIKLRKAFGDNSREPRVIQTVAKCGYCLIAEVLPVDIPAPGHQPVTGVPAGRRWRTSAWFPWPVLALLVLLAGGLATGWFMAMPEQQAVTLPAHDKPALVVLPFINLGHNAQDSYFSDGITEDITTDLSKYSGLHVIARHSAFVYKTLDQSIQRVRQELDVDYIVTGSVRRSEDLVRVNVQLVDAATGYHIWAERFDNEMRELLDVQDRIRREILSALAIPLTAEEKKFTARQYTDSIEAYDLFLQAQAAYVTHTRSNNHQARRLLQQALSIDPEFARAYSLLALTHLDDFRFAWSKEADASVQQAVELARKAIELDEQLPQAHWVLGNIYLFGLEQHDAALVEGQRTIELDPNHADGYTTLAVTNIFTGHPDLSRQYVSHAMRLNPHYPSQYPSVMGYAYYYLENYAEAEKYLVEATRINPNRLPPAVYLAAVYSAQGKNEDAAWQFGNIRMLDETFTIDAWTGRLPFRDKGMREKLVRDLQQARAALE